MGVGSKLRVGGRALGYSKCVQKLFETMPINTPQCASAMHVHDTTQYTRSSFEPVVVLAIVHVMSCSVCARLCTRAFSVGYVTVALCCVVWLKWLRLWSYIALTYWCGWQVNNALHCGFVLRNFYDVDTSDWAALLAAAEQLAYRYDTRFFLAYEGAGPPD